MKDWSEIDYFEAIEFADPLVPGSADEIDEDTFDRVVWLRKRTGWPLVPHGIIGGCVDINGDHGHSEKSYHLATKGCKAVDFHFNTNADPREQFHRVVNAGFTGVGVYYDWHWNGKLLPIGFHGDLRPVERAQIWRREKGQYIYFLE